MSQSPPPHMPSRIVERVWLFASLAALALMFGAPVHAAAASGGARPPAPPGPAVAVEAPTGAIAPSWRQVAQWGEGGSNAPRVTSGIIAEGMPSETMYTIRDSGIEGPTVLVIGGMHGNEPAGAVAAEQMMHWPVRQGRLVIVPRANPPALEQNVRRIPGKPRAAGDLNRNFPATRSDRGIRGPTAGHLWAFIEDIKPDWVVDLHEGFDFHARNPRSVGSTVIYPADEDMSRIAQLMLDAVNAEVSADEKKFQSVPRGPRETGLVRAAMHHLGSRGFVIETTWKDQPMSLRVRQHRLMLHALLRELEMVEEGTAHIVLSLDRSSSGAPTTIPMAVFDTGDESDDLALRVAVYDGPGAGAGGVNALERIVSGMGCAEEGAGVAGGGGVFVTVSAADIRDGVLAQFDVVIFPGGRGGAQGAALEEAGREQVRAFVDRGGGYLGICAGAYLATCRLGSYLKVVRSYHHRPWQLGRGPVEIELTDAGADLLRVEARRFEVRYANGPLFVHEDGRIPDLDLPDYEVLAVFRRGVEVDGEPRPEMNGMPAIIAAPYGAGRVLLISPHPESSSSLAWMVERAIEWAAGERRCSALRVEMGE